MGRRPILQAVAVFVWAASVLAQDGTLSAQITNTAPDVRDLPGVLVSRHLLEAEALAVGDIVRLSADDTGNRARPFRVVGVYEPTPDPLRITGRRLEARLHLPDLIDLTADAADPRRVPGFLMVIGADGPIGYATRLSIEEDDDPETGEPRRVVVESRGYSVALRLEVDVEEAAMTRMDRAGFGTELDFYQLRARFHVVGRVGDRTIDFTAPGSAETFRGR